MPAAHRGIKIFHMEAGLRAWDARMPEQRNRMLIDHMSSILLPFNHYHRENLMRENIHPSKIFVSGNPTFEVMRAFLPQIEASDILKRLWLCAEGLYPGHRPPQRERRQPRYLARIFEALGELAQQLQAARSSIRCTRAPGASSARSRSAEGRRDDGAAGLLRFQPAADARLVRPVRLGHGPGGGAVLQGALRQPAHDDRAPGDGRGRRDTSSPA